MNVATNCIRTSVSRVMPKFVYAFIIAASLVAALGCSSISEDDPPVVFAAASLSDVLAEVAEEYTVSTGSEMAFNFAGSTLLANQIVTGAPASAIVTAGFTPIQALIDADRIEREEVRSLFSNSMVVVKSGIWTERLAMAPEELVGAGRIALPDPGLAPAGEYAEAALRNVGIWEGLQDQIVPTLDVRAALSAAATANTEWAIVYRTDAMSSDDVSIVYEFENLTPESSPSYYFALLEDDPVLAGFSDFLRTSVAQKIFEEHGFTIKTIEPQ